MGIVVEMQPFKNWQKKWIHKLFKCPTFWKSLWNTFWSSKPFYRCPQCKKALHCYWDGNDTNRDIDFCNECASEEVEENILDTHIVSQTLTINYDNIDVSKCIGCRKGISIFTEENGEFLHLDLFASIESGSIYKCENTETIGKYLIQNGHRGTWLPSEELKTFFSKQAMWWEDIISLAYDTFNEQKLVNDFFNDGKKDHKNWNLKNIEIENKLIENALEKGVKVSQENYPDLIRWEINQ